MPVTDDQREIWLASQLDPEASASYHLSEVITLEGIPNELALAHAVQELANRHDALRINFAEDGVTQVVAAQRTQLLEVVALDEDVSEDTLKRLCVERIREPFDFAEDPLFRSILFKRGANNSALLLVVHHIIADGWSFGVLLRELSLLYAERVAGAAPTLGPAMQYRDYVSWLGDTEAKAREESAREYWREVFREPPAYLELPADRQRPTVKTFRAGHLREFVETALYRQLQSASRQNRCTLFQLMFAGLVALLYRMTGQTDIVVGVPHAGQVSIPLSGVEGSEGLVGHCANLLPLRFRDVETRSFESLLLDVKRQLLEARNHQEFTFSKLAEVLDIQRDPSRVPVVSVSLNMVRPGEFGLGGLDTDRCVLPKEFNFFDLTIDLEPGGRDLCLDTKFNRDLYEPGSVRRWLSQWRRILEQVVETPGIAVSQLELVTMEERDRILKTWNSTERSYEGDGLLHSLVESRVDREPNRTALVCEDESLTYLNLERRANAIAYQLQDLGVVPGQLVGVCLDRSPDMVATLLAVLKCGAAYVPLDPTYPRARIAYVLEDAATVVLVSDEKTLQHLPPLPCKILSLDGNAAEIESQPTTRLEPIAGPDDLAYVIYTSGSTGRPKGVQIEHRAAVNFVNAMAERPGLGSRDVLLAVTTVAFDIALLELFLPLYVGARIVLASRETAHDPAELARTLSRDGVTVMQATPATWGMLVESGWMGSPDLKVLCGGEALAPKLATDLLARCGELWNMYGPTETTVWSTCHRVKNGADLSIGRPIANTQVYILDKTLDLQPVGVPGELMLGGAGLARGYLRRSELTAEKFIESPFGRGQRLYRTGDLARFRDDGTIECLGRVDFQVKIRGFRVELGEVEAALLSQTAVAQAVATASEDASKEKQLVAYIKTTSGSVFDESALREAVKTALPDYMVPSRIVELETFPLTPNGKVDRRALPRPSVPVTRETSGSERPRGEIEAGLEAVLTALLRVGQVGRHDNFFDIGGHSLLGVRYFNEIYRVYGVRLPVSTLLQAGSIAQLAREIGEQQQQRREATCLVPIQVGGTKPKFFCVHGAGGNILFYRDLSRVLGNDFPFYGLQSRGLDGISEPLSSIEEMAVAYVEAIRAVQAEGPYFLGGYCLGGVIAYEMARILQGQGEQIGLLALLDTYNLDRRKRSNPLADLKQRAWFHLENLLHVPFAQWSSYLRHKLRIANEGEFKLITESLFNRTRVGPKSAQDRVHYLNCQAAGRYCPRPYQGVVTNFKPKKNYSAFADPDMGWGPLALGGIRNIELDLNPHAMLAQPFVGQLADALSHELSSGADRWPRAARLVPGISRIGPSVRQSL